MARNERFRALQTEKMTGLMGTLKTKNQDLAKLVKFGLDSLDRKVFFIQKVFKISITTSFWNLFKRSTALSPDDAKTDQAFKGVVEKFEAHNYIHQVNKLEECYDSWLDYPLGEKKGIFCLETKV